MSAGILPALGAVFLDHPRHAARDQRVGELEVGRALVGAGGGGRVVAGAGRGGTRVEVLGPGERLADQLAADDSPVHLDQRAVGLTREEELREPGHDAG